MIERNIKAKCAVCRNEVMIDEFGQGCCSVCGWEQNVGSLDARDKVFYPNTVSYNKAIKCYAQGKPFKPSTAEFIEMYKYYGEMEFYYKGKRYGIVGLPLSLYEFNNMETEQQFDTIEELFEKAHINGALLKDIWDDVEGADYMSCID